MSADPSLTVLLVQPYGDSLDLYSEFLRAQNVSCVPVTNMSDALAAATRADVIVTGILLPGSPDGVELITRLRADPGTARIPIIVLTACAFETQRQRAEAAGCDAFLSKPCLPSELYAEIRRLAGTPALREVRGRPLKASESRRTEEKRKMTGG